MPDITMCVTDCKIKNDCYRHEADPNGWQSYAEFKPNNCENGVICEHYIPLYKEKSKNVLEKRDMD